MTIRIVQSKQNSRVKELRTALFHPDRAPAGIVGLEGMHLVAEALRSGIQLETLFVAQGSEDILEQPPLAAHKLADSVEVILLPREILHFAVTTETPQPIAALARYRVWKWQDLLFATGPRFNPLIVVLAGIQDPGNLGTILRSAEAFGASFAVTLLGTVSPWNPKAMRASAGSVFRLPLLASSASYCFDRFREARVRTLAAMAHEAQPLGEVDLTGPLALIIGSEGTGLPPELAAQCDGRITIPCPGPVESLNAAVAASILLYESSIQRAQPPIARRP